MKLRWEIVLPTAGSLALLVFLYSYTRAINHQEHDLFTQNIQRFKERHAALKEDLVKVQYVQMSSYDSLVSNMNELRTLNGELGAIPEIVGSESRSTMNGELQAQLGLIDEAEALLERLKSGNSKLKNSLAYFPIIAGELSEKAASDSESPALQSIFSDILRDMLIFNLQPDEGLAATLRVSIQSLSGDGQDFGPAISADDIQILAVHALTILDNRVLVDDMTDELLSLPISEPADNLFSIYTREFDETLERAALLRLLLFSLVIVLGAGISYVFIQLDRSHRALNTANEELETRVQERTRELVSTNEELEKVRDQALDASRAKSGFLANMSHELRTPLNAIIGYSEMLQEDAEDEGLASYTNDLEKINSAGKHLLALINDILDLSKIEAGRMEMHIEDINVQALVDDVIATIQPLAQQNENELIVECEVNVGRMHTDITRLRQCLFNLLSNACKFTEKGSVRLKAVRETGNDGEWLIFQVRDTGIGISQEQINRIFEAFMQAEISTTRKYGGTGLGLALSREFCLLMGGDISVESTLGKGSTFSMRLPVGIQKRPAPQPDTTRERGVGHAPGDSADGGVIVLVVDDDVVVQDLLTRMLEKDGYRVITASSGEKAIELAREHKPFAITLDILMPAMDGWSVLSQLKGDPALAEIPVIIVSILEEQRIGFSLGASDYLTKPVDRERLLAVLKKYESPKESASILVVDDEAGTREMLRRTLEKSGYAVIEAEDGRVALEKLKEHPVKLILLDLIMPNLDGFQFLRELAKDSRHADTPVVVLTAKTLSAEERQCLRGQVNDVIQKGSLSQEELLEYVSRRLETLKAARVT